MPVQTDTDTDDRGWCGLQSTYTRTLHTQFTTKHIFIHSVLVYIYTPVECIKNVTTCRYFMQPNNANLVLCGIMQQWMNKKKKKETFSRVAYVLRETKHKDTRPG